VFLELSPGAAPFFFEYRTEPRTAGTQNKNGPAQNCPETALSSRSASAGSLYRRFRLCSFLAFSVPFFHICNVA